ncbi:hypothetical protein C0992_003617 [Termitomyces sp. T32_za158]|nr:hypothetical protein C0992_003617 [Termitomyces sp. T32_za158]
MPPSQRQLAIRSIQIAHQGLDITVNSPTYREGMKYAVHYTHATATFAASFLLRLARLFPNDCNVTEIRSQVERLANLMSQVPGKRYALTLQLMLTRSKKRKPGSTPRSPNNTREPHWPVPLPLDHPAGVMSDPGSVHQRHPEVLSPYDPSLSDQVHVGSGHQYHAPHYQPQQMQHQYPNQPSVSEAEYISKGFDKFSNEQLPVWISDQSLGINLFNQNGMDAFLLPNDYMPPAPQIW